MSHDDTLPPAALMFLLRSQLRTAQMTFCELERQFEVLQDGGLLASGSADAVQAARLFDAPMVSIERH
jgi:hypothetical protein